MLIFILCIFRVLKAINLTLYGIGVARDGAPGAGCKDKKKVFAERLMGFWSKSGWRSNKMNKQGLHHKSVEFWFQFHIIIWCHPKMVSPGAGRGIFDHYPERYCFVNFKDLHHLFTIGKISFLSIFC